MSCAASSRNGAASPGDRSGSGKRGASARIAAGSRGIRQSLAASVSQPGRSSPRSATKTRAPRSRAIRAAARWYGRCSPSSTTSLIARSSITPATNSGQPSNRPRKSTAGSRQTSRSPRLRLTRAARWPRAISARATCSKKRDCGPCRKRNDRLAKPPLLPNTGCRALLNTPLPGESPGPCFSRSDLGRTGPGFRREAEQEEAEQLSVASGRAHPSRHAERAVERRTVPAAGIGRRRITRREEIEQQCLRVRRHGVPYRRAG